MSTKRGTQPLEGPRYLGDGIYIEWEAASSMFLLFTWNGIEKKSQIYLEEEPARALINVLQEKYS